MTGVPAPVTRIEEHDPEFLNDLAATAADAFAPGALEVKHKFLLAMALDAQANHPGGVKSTTPQKVLGGRFPERVLEKAVERMLPKESPLARKQMTHLRLFAGSAHDHEAQKPETIDFKSASPKNTRSV